MIAKTNAMRALDQRKIPYQAFSYDEAVHSADEVAAILGVSAAQVFKTLVVLRDNGRALLAVAPGDHELDLKRLAAGAGEKRLRMASKREAEALTGLLTGGISSLALLNKGYAVFLDASARAFDEIYMSAGQRGINLRLRVDDFVKVTGARFVEMVRSGDVDE
jgi:Cys-tRNA(Pro)/Cys-tRNA(Cys) deacylase